MTEGNDPRVFFAAERTLLAWLRTGIAAIGLGFVVARFGYFLTIISGQTDQPHYASSVIGTVLVIMGTLTVALSSWQHARFLSTLTTQDLPRRYSAKLSLVLTTLMVLAGLTLATYIILTTGSTIGAE